MKDDKTLKNKLNAIYGINGQKACNLEALYRQYILARTEARVIDSDAVYR